VDGEAALDVVEETEVLAGLLDGDHIFKSQISSVSKTPASQRGHAPWNPAG
jgi:hypothetical protein